MRMWNTPTETLCRKHLLGEHVEAHMFASTINSSRSLRGYINKGLFDIRNLETRHTALASEMLQRGYKHNSPFPVIKYINEPRYFGFIDVESNLRELQKRCADCANLIQKYY